MTRLTGEAPRTAGWKQQKRNVFGIRGAAPGTGLWGQNRFYVTGREVCLVVTAWTPWDVPSGPLTAGVGTGSAQVPPRVLQRPLRFPKCELQVPPSPRRRPGRDRWGLAEPQTRLRACFPAV